ncbi:glycogen debranching enzyme GlgX, partial [Aeromonas veronii]
YEGDSAVMVPCALVVAGDFDWQGVAKPAHAPDELIVYEAHVKGMTRLHPGVPEALRGTYLGMCHLVMIDHLTELG